LITERYAKRAFWLTLALAAAVSVWIALPGASAPVAHASPSASPAACAPPAGQNISTGIGSTAGSGIADSIWTVTSAPGGVPTPSAYPIIAYPGWVSAPANTNWLDPNNTGVYPHSDPTSPPPYVYETSFSVPSGMSTLTLQFSYAADNDVDVKITGPNLPVTTIATLSGGIGGNFGLLHGVTYSVPAYAGTYTLSAEVSTSSGPVGWLLSGRVVCVPAPAPCAAAGGVNISTGIGSTAGSGVADTIWTVPSAPGGVPTPGAYPIITYPGWVAAPAGTNWLDPNNTGVFSHFDPSSPPVYLYQTPIVVPPGMASLSLDLYVAVDNNVVVKRDVTTLLTLSGSASSNFSTLVVPSHHVVDTLASPSAGTHLLSAEVDNAGGPVGLLVQGTATCVAAVGGVAEHTDASALPAVAPAPSGRGMLPYVLTGIGAILALTAVGGGAWRVRRSRP
jgi:hypothetical protein